MVGLIIIYLGFFVFLYAIKIEVESAVQEGIARAFNNEDGIKEGKRKSKKGLWCMVTGTALAIVGMIILFS